VTPAPSAIVAGRRSGAAQTHGAGLLARARARVPWPMQIPKGMVVERIRSTQGPEAADRADAELPEKIDTDRDVELLRSFDLDPQQLADGLGGQSPAIG
jgi:hypothetical protein